jgi:hypothetical protein
MNLNEWLKDHERGKYEFKDYCEFSLFFIEADDATFLN